MARLSIRATNELKTQTQTSAEMLGLNNSEYVRQAVLEKNSRLMQERLASLSRKLSSRHLALNASLDDSTGDGVD